MKKLVGVILIIPTLLVTLIVPANTTIEKAGFNEVSVYFREWDSDTHRHSLLHTDKDEIITRRIELDKSLLSVQLSNSDEPTHFIYYKELPNLLSQINFWDSIISYWDSETDTIQILSENFLKFEQQLNEIQVIEPIDINNVNLDEWINISFFSTLNNGYEYTFSVTRNNNEYTGRVNSGDASIIIQRHTVDLIEVIDSLGSTIESSDIVSSIVNCNTANIRVIEVNHSYEVNIQDLKNNNIFSDEEISRMLEIRAIYGTVAEYDAVMHFNSFKEIVKSGELSNEELSVIINRLEQLGFNDSEIFYQQSFLPTSLFGIFAPTTVLANTSTDISTTEFNSNLIIEKIEFSNTKVLFDRWPRNDIEVLDVQMQGSDKVYKFVSIQDIVPTNPCIKWDAEINSLEITNRDLAFYEIMREQNPIIEPIDMSNINPDEWISTWVATNGLETNFILSPSSVIINLLILDNTTTITSIVGCNAQKIRTVITSDYAGQRSILINVQDLIDEGLISVEQLELIPSAREEERLMNSNELQFTPQELIRRDLEHAMTWAVFGMFPEEIVAEMLQLAVEAKD